VACQVKVYGVPFTVCVPTPDIVVAVASPSNENRTGVCGVVLSLKPDASRTTVSAWVSPSVIGISNDCMALLGKVAEPVMLPSSSKSSMLNELVNEVIGPLV